MSQFLAPIHTWLFNKIVILEGIEKDLTNQFSTKEQIEVHSSLLDRFGDFIPNEPLENLIDESNIHGWLQERITIAETRQAAFVQSLLEENQDNLQKIEAIYKEEGKKAAKKKQMRTDTPSEVFQGLNNVLLEGMPCDRVNSVISQDDNAIVWKTTHCVHKGNWENNGVDVQYFYGFRAAFTQGFVEASSEQLSYTYTYDKGQTHSVAKV